MNRKLSKLLVVSGIALSSAAIAQTARVQVIHNSADAAAATVDVWLNSTLLIDNFNFRTASPFVTAPAGVPLTIGVAPSNSTNASQSIATFPVTLTSNETYVVVANGIVSASGYSPAPAFDLDIYATGREEASIAGNTDVLVVHGSTDAPTVDVEVPGAGTVVNDLAYGSFNPYLQLPTADYTLNITDQTGATVVASYQAPLQTLGLEDSALVVVASGFLNPANNSNSTNTFGLWVALPEGGNLIPLPASTARVQVIHNSADAAASTVDVYLGTTLLIDNFAFRTASPFIDAPAETAQTIGIAPANSTSSSQSIATFPVTLAANETYVVVANGIVSASGYSPAPAFDLDIYANGREAALVGTNTDILVVHGSTDAPVVDVEVSNTTIVNDIAYGEFQGYLAVATSDLVLDITDATGATVVASYAAPLAGLALQGKAITVVASGFLNPANNSNSANTFGLWVALNTGGNLVPLSTPTSIEENSIITSLNVYPNPVNDQLNLNMSLESNSVVAIEIYDVTGKLVLNNQLGTITSGNFVTQLNMSSLSTGMYNVSIVTENARKNIRVNVNH
ncbi:MAG: DUF4397 domain-containing protein [Bacteroidia bacterium]|nr:DUF4397 domain-containing protein [Bacteroidia bacterium]